MPIYRKAQAEINDEVEKVKADVSKYVAFTQDQFNLENSFMIYQLAGTFTLLGCLISMWHMTAHLREFNQPFVQRRIMAILWMVSMWHMTAHLREFKHPFVCSVKSVALAVVKA